MVRKNQKAKFSALKSISLCIFIPILLTLLSSRIAPTPPVIAIRLALALALIAARTKAATLVRVASTTLATAHIEAAARVQAEEFLGQIPASQLDERGTQTGCILGLIPEEIGPLTQLLLL